MLLMTGVTSYAKTFSTVILLLVLLLFHFLSVILMALTVVAVAVSLVWAALDFV
jgi:hypothetical protein